MEKLNQIIESMAKAQYHSDVLTPVKMNEFMLKHATIKEFVDFFANRRTDNGKAWVDRYHDTKIGNMQGLAETFCKEVLWVRLKDEYIEKAVNSLEQKVEQSFKITIESI